MINPHYNAIMRLRVSVLFVAVVLSSFCLGQTKHHLVVELCSKDYGFTINNVENLRKAFGTETCEIEVVCHGPGIDLLFSHDNKLAPRIQKLSKTGVKFAACANTLRNRKIGKDRIFPFVAVVDSGTAEVIRMQEAGWSYLRR